MFHGSDRIFFIEHVGKKCKNAILICTRNPASFSTSGLRAFVASSKNYRTASDERARIGLGTRLSTQHVAKLEDGEQFCVAKQYLIKFMRSLVIFILFFCLPTGSCF